MSKRMKAQTNSRNRSFDEKSELHGNIWRRVAVVHCHDCGAVATLGIKHAQTLLPPDVVAKKFAQRGWDLGTNSHRDLCPVCVTGRATKKTLAACAAKETAQKGYEK
jgi:hypothetical protein